ncbi:protein-disulfide reductase DsbD family protein [Arenibaculum sp.]|uniref:protein-disulfide reductase DsbD family protein n=1 Tax=Arenibaculum sp. TaxID=2865862 RepID=UPI002E10EF0A|nr:protein-disulfide reductase DsbD domain-containing protein [Arenibaculum sp.]
MIRQLAASALLLLTAAASQALAAAGPWQQADMVEARLVSAVEATGGLDRVPLGLQVRLAPGWKTYWRSPGDAGLPPVLDWSGSANLEEAALAWPAPHRFTLFGLETFGYDAEVVFPIEAAPARPGEPLDLKAAVDLLVCSDVCVPQRFDLDLALPAGPAAPGDEAQLIDRYRALVPGDGTASGLSVEQVSVTEGGLRVVARGREPLVEPDVFVETGAGHAFAAPELSFSDGGHRAVIDLPLAPASAAAAPVEPGRPLVLTLVDGARSAELRVAPSAAAAGPMAGEAGALPAILALALLGGLILNLMPCVLPVLSLKLFSVIGHGAAAPGAIRAGFLASAAGILFSFLLLAAVLVGLREAGAAVGWGIQFQQPLFLAFMAVVVTLFAGNLWGLFEVPLPWRLARLAGGGGGRPTLAGHFATGAFATLLATPCSAPFLGTAVGFALARGPAEILAVFTALGIGLASPYLLVAAWPRLAALLPRPGRWMIVLRRVLGATLALTAVWLLSVLAVQVGAAAAYAVGGALAAALLALALRRRLPPGLRPAGAMAAVVLALAALGVPAVLERTAQAAPDSAADARWARFDLDQVRARVAEGRVVLVDVTADWCITCRANKMLVLGRGEVARRLSDDVLAMQADWTLPDPEIAGYLASFGRYGIPFDVVYGPAAPEGIALPELLSEQAVLDAFDQAAGRPAT